MRYLHMFFIAVAILITVTLAAESITVLRPRAMLREGPGSYYSVIDRVDEGAELQVASSTDGWYQVNWRDTLGWLPVRVTKPLRGSSELVSSPGDSLAIRITRHGMSAGAKGFAAGVARKYHGDVDVAEYLARSVVNERDFKDFRRDSKRKYKIKPQKKPRIPDFEGADWFSDREEVTGLALASGVVSELGLYVDAEWTRYINNVCCLVAQSSDVYDTDFRVYILNIPQPNAYAFPGGLILVTRGMLKMCRNEAELACVLGHEIAHVARKHGMRELQQRANQISAEDAFAELDEEFGGFDASTRIIEQNLEDDVFQMYEYLVQGRLDAYEEEADLLGCIYVSRAGYDPRAFLDLLTRLQDSPSNNDHYRPEFTRKRLVWLRKNLKTLPERGVMAEERWQRHERIH